MNRRRFFSAIAGTIAYVATVQGLVPRIAKALSEAPELVPFWTETVRVTTCVDEGYIAWRAAMLCEVGWSFGEANKRITEKLNG